MVSNIEGIGGKAVERDSALVIDNLISEQNQVRKAYEEGRENDMIAKIREEGQPNGRYSLNKETFYERQKRAVVEKGTVMPGLADKEVKVVNVPRHDFTGERPIAKAKQWAKQNIVGEHILSDSDGKKVSYTISNHAVDKFLSASAIDKSENLGVHLSVLKVLPKMISESIEVEIHPDYLKSDNLERQPKNGYNPDNLVHRFYGLISISGEQYRVKTTIIENGDRKMPNKAHSFEVINIELLPKDSSSKLEPMVSPNELGVPHGTANLLKGVEKSYDKGKFLLDESEKIENDIKERTGGRYSLRTEEPPKKVKTAYAAYRVKVENGKPRLFPMMIKMVWNTE